MPDTAGWYCVETAFRQSLLTTNGVDERIEETDYWKGTVIYFELYSDKEIDPNKVLENRTDAVSEFNDEFLDTEDIDNLW